jgi:hypothetical protein
MRQFWKGVVAGGVGAVVATMATAAIAGSGVGGVFNLGTKNSVNATTTLTGGTSGAQLHVTNSGSVPALGLKVGSGKALFTVNSSGKVGSLNADLLDGLDAANFVQGGGQARSYFLTQTGKSAAATVLTIPGFGKITAACESIGVTNVVVKYVNGSHRVDLWYEVVGDDLSADAEEESVDASTSTDLPNVGSPGVDTRMVHLVLHYTAISGFFVFQHVATVVLAEKLSGDPCSEAVSMVVGAPRFQP